MCTDKVQQPAQWRSPIREGFLKEVGDWLLGVGGGGSESTASMRHPPPQGRVGGMRQGGRRDQAGEGAGAGHERLGTVCPD